MNLQQYLEKTGITDQAFADAVGLTQSYISRLRRGLVSPSLEAALKVQHGSKGKVKLETLLPRGHAAPGGSDRKAV